MDKYALNIKSHRKIENNYISADSEELAIYEALDMLEIKKGKQWVKNSSERIKRDFNSIENRLATEGVVYLGYDVLLVNLKIVDSAA